MVTEAQILNDETAPPVQTLHVYYGRMTSMKYVFKDGREAIFQPDPMDPGRSIYRTAEKVQYDELDAEAGVHSSDGRTIKIGTIPFIYKLKGNETITSDLVDPVEAFKAQIIREYEQRKALELANPNNDRGGYNPEPVKPTNTADLGVLAGGPGAGLTQVNPIQPAAQRMLSIAGLTRPGPK